MKEKIMKWLPLILVEIYLGITIIFLQCGPIQYNLQNEFKFWILIFLYHLAFIVGYLVFIRRKKVYTTKQFDIDEIQIRKMYWLVLIVAFFVWLVVYRNGTHANSYIPYELPQNFIRGLINPAERYYWKLTPEAIEQFSGNKLITMISSIFYPVYYFMPVLLVVLWKYISRVQKVLSYVQMFLTLATGISVATNKYLFDLLFLVMGGLLIEIICQWEKEGKIFFKTRKIIVCTVIFLVIFDVGYFTYNLRDRTGNLSVYIENMSENIIVDKIEVEPEVKPQIKTDSSFLNDMIVGLQSYICQGYYGFSVALDKEFTTTYGLGHSNFCLSTLNTVFGIDIVERTFQEKITEQWSRTSKWHSFYSQMANDVGFYGVICVMFVIGLLLSIVWSDAYYENSILAKCLLVLFVIMFLYLPANNQLGNGAGTFFAFWETIFLWIFTKIKRISVIRR